MSMGFSHQPAAPDTDQKPCTHRGQWGFRSLGDGMLVRYCEGCGHTDVLAQMPDTTFALIQVPEYGLEKWNDLSADVSSVAEDLPGLRADEDEQPVSSGPVHAGWATQPVQDVQACPVPDSDAAALPDEESAA